ncbi:MAG TPA: hypothetical protein VH950_06060 [Gaiellaceae bacterium]|jgi:hypothetical protein
MTGKEPLPPPLPPETRTVGQLVAESIRLYGRNVWAALAIGVPPAVIDLTATGFSRTETLLAVPLLGAALVTISYVGAVSIATGAPIRHRNTLLAYLVGALIFLPFPFLAVAFILPGLAWFALIGLAVPAAMVEGRGFRGSLARGIELGRADYVHALGGLATLTIVVFLTRSVAYVLFQNFAENTTKVAATLADIVISPLLFLGTALLYHDQAARVGSPRPARRRRNAALHDAVDADREGHPDAELESGPTA